MISRFGNSPAFNVVFGDSSYIVYYLKWIGYRLNKVVQTGANFGLDQRHDNPLLCDIGSGTMVSDGLTMLNMSMSSTAFKISKVTIGEQNYFGNNIFYPAASKTGANCLLGTKVMVPIDGLVRENIGLLGSPCFEIPRVVERDKAAKLAIDAKTFQQQLSAKNRYNLVTILGVFAANWLLLFIMLLVGFSAFSLTDDHGVLFIFSLWALLSLLAIAWYGLIERTSLGFGSLTPQLVSMYDERFWRHERHWKFCGSPLMTLFKGTPFKNVISRILGVELGRKVFDDGALFYDKTLLAVGDHTTLNEGCVLQGHSLEEGVFKCDRVKIGSGCTLGAASFTHYGVTMGHDVTVDPDSFVMKGEIVDANSTWQGNPAKAIHVAPAEPRAGFGRKDAVLAPAVAAQ
jgi:non-ribosomal peptide synthetase-like protein